MSHDYIDSELVATIETALDDQLPDGWRKLTATELKKQTLIIARVGWIISVVPGTVACPGVDHLLVLTDSAFPQSQPRVVAPQADQNYSWPHVEPGGLLCLKSTMVNADPGQRLLQHISWALELLNFPEKIRRSEFKREFSAYWNYRLSTLGKIKVLSLLAPNGPSREIVWFADMPNQRIFVAEDHSSLIRWLRHSGNNPSDKYIYPSWLEWLPQPWIPSEFPEHGFDVIKHLSAEVTGRILYPGRDTPVVFGATTVTGNVFVATLLRSAAVKDISKGFRRLSQVPAVIIKNHFSARTVKRCPVLRVDASWVHGRDRDPVFRSISKRKVAIIGCGSLGAAIARLLAQAGVGNFILVDQDNLTAQNTSRHVLGQRFLCKNKANATVKMLEEDFPHIISAIPMPHRFHTLSADQLELLTDCDVIISAGIDYEGDIQIDSWRRLLPRPPVHICTWVEAFAIVGHAISLFGRDTLLDAFDDEEQINFRLTDWPQESGSLVVEAGCGNVFQPHGAIELHTTVTIASGLVLDVLCGKVSTSLRRVWQGDRSEVKKHGGTILSAFTDNLCVKEYPWR